MEESALTTPEPAPLDPDEISLVRWFMAYGLLAAALVAALVTFAATEGWSWSRWMRQTGEAFAATGPAVKLLFFALYLTVCTTFLPLPANWMVAAMATREAALTAGLSDSLLVTALTTTLLIATVGAIGSTVANLNDYHIFTWILRSRRVAKVRQTRVYQRAAQWFSRSPFFLLVVFNMIPIPVDVVRMLATTYRYARAPFAAANFIGRFFRYGIIAFVTYWWDLGWIAPAALLSLAVALGLARLVMAAVARRKPANHDASGVSKRATDA